MVISLSSLYVSYDTFLDHMKKFILWGMPFTASASKAWSFPGKWGVFLLSVLVCWPSVFVPRGRFNWVAKNSKIPLLHSRRSYMVCLTCRPRSFRCRAIYSCVVRIAVAWYNISRVSACSCTHGC